LAAMPHFHVIDNFTLESRKLAVLAGSVVDGTIRRGQFLRVLFEGSHHWLPIEAIEFARRKPDQEDVCLCVGYAALDALGLPHMLPIKEVTLEVASSAA
jgi:hypothetical protein